MEHHEAVEPEDQEMEAKLVNEEYKIWKKNSPFLYDMILRYSPSTNNNIYLVC